MKAKFVIEVSFDKEDYHDDEDNQLEGQDLIDALSDELADGTIDFTVENIESVEVTE